MAAAHNVSGTALLLLPDVQCSAMSCAQRRAHAVSKTTFTCMQGRSKMAPPSSGRESCSNNSSGAHLYQPTLAWQVPKRGCQVGQRIALLLQGGLERSSLGRLALQRKTTQRSMSRELGRYMLTPPAQTPTTQPQAAPS